MPVDREPSGGFSPAPSTPAPGTEPSFGDVFNAAVSAQRTGDNVLAANSLRDRLYDERIDAVKKATGVELFHPLRSVPTDEDFREREGFTAIHDVVERRWHRELDRLAEQFPDKRAIIRPEATVWKEAAERARADESRLQDRVSRSGLTATIPGLGIPLNPAALAGSLWGSMHDPINAAAMLLGPNGSAARSILWNAGRQAGFGAVSQAALEPFVQSWRAEAGMEHGLSDAARNIFFAGTFGGAIDAAGRSAGRLVLGRPMGGVPEPVKPPPAPAPGAPPDAAAAVPSTLADVAPTPEMRTLAGAVAEGGIGPATVERLTDLEGPIRRPPPADVGDALDAAISRLPDDHVVKRAAAGEPAALMDMTATSADPAVRAARQLVEQEIATHPAITADVAEAEALERLANHIRHASDPETVPPAGDPIATPRGAAETSPAPAELKTALANGDLGVVDTAITLRENPELAELVPPTTQGLRDAHAVARLSEPGLALVEGRVLAAEYAAIIADAAPATRHAELIEKIAALQPADADHVRRLVADLVQQPTTLEGQQVLLSGSGDRFSLPLLERIDELAGRLMPERIAAAFERIGNEASFLASALMHALRERPRAGLARYRIGRSVEDPGRLFMWSRPPKSGTVLMFHGTEAKFTKFDGSKTQDFGTHFGTAEQAWRRLQDEGRLDEPRTIPVEVTVNNAVAIRRDLGVFSPRAIVEALEQRGALSHLSAELRKAVRDGAATLTEQMERARRAIDDSTEPEQFDRRVADYESIKNDAHAALGRWLDEQAGIDGVWYPNTVEGTGWSLLVWKEGQVSNAISRDVMMALPQADSGPTRGGRAIPEPARLDAAVAEIARTHDMGEIRAQLQAIAERLPKPYSMRLARALKHDQAGAVNGLADRETKLIWVALSSADPVKVARHEEVHALRELGLFTAAEWKILDDAVERFGLMKKYRIVERYSDYYAKRFEGDESGAYDAAMREEAIAHMIADYGSGQRFGGPIDKLLAVWHQVVDAVRDMLGKEGITRVDDIIRAIESGEIGARSIDTMIADVARTQRQAELSGGRLIEDEPPVPATPAPPSGPRQTIEFPGFGTPEYEAARTFSVGDKQIQGYAAAIDHLRKVAVADVGPGGVAYARQATIVIGPPGAGKSTINRVLSGYARSAVVTADDPKFIMPEMKTLGAEGVHEEASILSKKVQNSFIGEGANIVIEKLGGSPKSIESLVQAIAKLDYEVRLVHVTAPRDMLIERIAVREKTTGRGVPTPVLDEALDGIGNTLDAMRQNRALSGIMSIDTSGKTPRIISGQETFDNAFRETLEAGIRQPTLASGDRGSPDSGASAGSRGNGSETGRSGEAAGEATHQRLAAPEFDKPAGDGAAGQIDMLKPLGDRLAPQKLAEGLPAGVEPQRLVELPGDVTITGTPLFALDAYHGTPHTFEPEPGAPAGRFKMSKIGSGEGAQAYGRGLYFAESEAVAQSYRDALGRRATDFRIDGKGVEAATPGERAILAALENKSVAFLARTEGMPAALAYAIRRLEEDGQIDRAQLLRDVDPQRLTAPADGHVYKVRLDVEPEQLLHWDRPIAEQPLLQSIVDKVQAERTARDGRGALRIDQVGRTTRDGGRVESMTGAAAYQYLAAPRYGDDATARLREAGIFGVRYLDQGSRDGGKGTHNIVMFDDSKIEITARDGDPVWPADLAPALERASEEADAGLIVKVCKFLGVG